VDLAAEEEGDFKIGQFSGHVAARKFFTSCLSALLAWPYLKAPLHTSRLSPARRGCGRTAQPSGIRSSPHRAELSNGARRWPGSRHAEIRYPRRSFLAAMIWPQKSAGGSHPPAPLIFFQSVAGSSFAPNSRRLPARPCAIAIHRIAPQLPASFHLDAHLSIEVAKKACARAAGHLSIIQRRNS
jgi:hypothetical protein